MAQTARNMRIDTDGSAANVCKAVTSPPASSQPPLLRYRPGSAACACSGRQLNHLGGDFLLTRQSFLTFKCLESTPIIVSFDTVAVLSAQWS